MTILENLSIADNKGKTYGLGRGTNHSRIEHYKEMLAELNLGLEDKLHTKVGALSGGQRQTLALLMATMNPIAAHRQDCGREEGHNNHGHTQSALRC